MIIDEKNKTATIDMNKELERLNAISKSFFNAFDSIMENKLEIKQEDLVQIVNHMAGFIHQITMNRIAIVNLNRELEDLKEGRENERKTDLMQSFYDSADHEGECN